MERMNSRNEQHSQLLLSEQHRHALQKECGLVDSVIADSQIFSANRDVANKFTGHAQPGIVFPYYDLKGEFIGARIRLSEPLINEDGKKIRYLQPKDASITCYFLPRSIPIILNVANRLIVVEG